MRIRCLPCLLGLLGVWATACSEGDGSMPERPTPPSIHGGWPTANAYSWNGAWSPQFPLEGLLDNEYHDGHDGTPILPPGEWDWDDDNDDLANWRNFEGTVGGFLMLEDDMGQHYGWTLTANDPLGTEVDARGGFFEGSAGADIFDLGPDGRLFSFGEGNLGDGPDVLIFNRANSLDYRTGSSRTGSRNGDDDLVIAGCDVNADATYDIITSTIHTGPGNDWVFIRDWERAALDLGNGEDGRTDRLDAQDGNDLAVIRGNARDFRIFGGSGDDTAVWYVDEVQMGDATWLGPNFFGGGGEGGALWDEGTDRLVMVVPTETPLVDGDPTDGEMRWFLTDGELVLDEPTQGDEFAAYCVECGTSPTGRRTLVLHYRNTAGTVDTAWFYVTAFEELQVGVGDDARVYRIDDVEGALIEDDTLTPLAPPAPAGYCD